MHEHRYALVAMLVVWFTNTAVAQDTKKPNILMFFGDDVGQTNIMRLSVRRGWLQDPLMATTALLCVLTLRSSRLAHLWSYSPLPYVAPVVRY